MDKTKKMPPACDTCYHYVDDEETGEPVCEIDLALDEDESYRLSGAGYKSCPFYRFNDEYISVRKQN